ncbi:hypothetical protein [Streptomyces chrestomyceticus]|uniref:Uncharacterized protein n=1 Tax=Streptomyces chrestomyceticus TaxID=68185 RepID=A0ABU7WLL2_9ACTN
MRFSFGIRLLLVLMALLLAVIVGLAAGVLAHADGARLPACIARAAAACGVALTLFLLVLTSLGALP